LAVAVPAHALVRTAAGAERALVAAAPHGPDGRLVLVPLAVRVLVVAGAATGALVLALARVLVPILSLVLVTAARAAARRALGAVVPPGLDLRRWRRGLVALRSLALVIHWDLLRHERGHEQLDAEDDVVLGGGVVGVGAVGARRAHLGGEAEWHAGLVEDELEARRVGGLAEGEEGARLAQPEGDLRAERVGLGRRLFGLRGRQVRKVGRSQRRRRVERVEVARVDRDAGLEQAVL
jgi:hypothetical protein